MYQDVLNVTWYVHIMPCKRVQVCPTAGSLQSAHGYVSGSLCIYRWCLWSEGICLDLSKIDYDMDVYWIILECDVIVWDLAVVYFVCLCVLLICLIRIVSECRIWYDGYSDSCVWMPYFRMVFLAGTVDLFLWCFWRDMYFQRTRVQGEQWKYDTMIRSLPSEVCLKPGCCCFGIVFGWGKYLKLLFILLQYCLFWLWSPGVELRVWSFN